MPARGFKRNILEIPAQVLIDLASDPKRYEKMLGEFADRKQAAEEAEAKARQAERDATEELERQRLAHQEEVARIAVRLAQHAEEAEARVAELSRWQEQLQSLERALGVREAEATAKQDKANADAAAVSDRSRAVGEREADVTRRETMLTKTEALVKERDADVSRREGLFKNRLRELNANL